MDLQWINLTPHELNIHASCEEVLTLPPSGKVARVSTEHKRASTLESVPVWHASTGEVVDLPPTRPARVLIVSARVRLAVPERGDVLSPGPLLRDTDGRPVGCRGLVRNPPQDMGGDDQPHDWEALHDGARNALADIAECAHEGQAPPSSAWGPIDRLLREVRGLV